MEQPLEEPWNNLSRPIEQLTQFTNFASVPRNLPVTPNELNTLVKSIIYWRKQKRYDDGDGARRRTRYDGQHA
jgi:hypothetical protein